MRSRDIAKSVSRLTSLTIASAFMVIAYVLPTSAVDSQITVSICGSQVPAAQITIDEPLSDSVVSTSALTVRGTVASASQIELQIDEQYVSSLAIGSGQTTFEIDTTLNPGTHTIQAIASGICGGQDATDSIVVTYRPEAEQPSNGDSTSTEVEGGIVVNPEGTKPEEIPQNDVAQAIEAIPVVGPVVNMVSDFATAIGLTNTIAGNNTSPVVGIARVGVTVVAITTVVMAGSIAPVAAQALPGVSELFNVNSHRSMIYFGWVIRGVGALAMALAYFL